MFRIEVKAKQAREWPGCRGIAAKDSFLVFVDFAGKSDTARPDFYILTTQEWRAFVEAEVDRYNAKYPLRHAEVTPDNVLIFPNEVNRYGKHYEGVGVRVEGIREHLEAWHKIARVVRKLDAAEVKE